MTIAERLRLQGLPVAIRDRCKGHVSSRQVGLMIGNALSVNVLEALLSKVLPACGLMTKLEEKKINQKRNVKNTKKRKSPA